MYWDDCCVLKDDREMLHWWIEAGQRVHRRAQYLTGVVYWDRYSRGKADEALWQGERGWLLAAKLRHCDAQYALGRPYAKRALSLRAEQEAVRWLLTAAERQHHQAQYDLGTMLYKGRAELRDAEEAEHWWHLAADHGIVEVQQRRRLGFWGC